MVPCPQCPLSLKWYLVMQLSCSRCVCSCCGPEVLSLCVLLNLLLGTHTHAHTHTQTYGVACVETISRPGWSIYVTAC